MSTTHTSETGALTASGGSLSDSNTPPQATTTAASSSSSTVEESTDIQLRLERKRIEHEQQRASQRKAFEQQMALLEQQQREEERKLHTEQQADAALAPTASTATTTSETATDDELASALDKMAVGRSGDAPFHERFLFDDELDNEDSAFVKKYNLHKDVRAQWPQLGNGASDAALAAAAAAANRKPDIRATPPSNAPFSSAAVTAAAPRGSPSPRPTAAPGSRFVPRAAYPSFPLAPGRFGPYAASADAARPGVFDAFNPTAAHGPLLYPTDKYSKMPPTGGPRKAELDVATRMEDLQGEIFALCKDQHGCRFLQKKLEEGSATHRDMIFAETFAHFAELMTDPFGNYLCQKMLEYCTDEQRNLIVESVAPELVTISLNMHGTRAVQKMIDFLSTSRQIHSIIVALSMNVVTLIKDLNGNHVIQKCLNRLSAEDNQFIYNAVAAHCVQVATHRHGCCVLQRCIDHASEAQRVQLVAEITYNALSLVQDAFGNYVVQYVLDLNIARFTDGVVRQFVGNVCLLSVQKFSSNVMEKCIRVSEPGVRKQLVEELLNQTRLEKLLRDSYANYVVQTSLDYADPVQRMRLVECIRPILPVIRNTPYGKRIQSKLQRDNLDFGPYNDNHQQQQQPYYGDAMRFQQQRPAMPRPPYGGYPSSTFQQQRYY